MNALDWPALMHAGLHLLALKPAEFWELSPAELMLMLGSDVSSEPINRKQIEALAAQFPDKKRKKAV